MAESASEDLDLDRKTRAMSPDLPSGISLRGILNLHARDEKSFHH